MCVAGQSCYCPLPCGSETCRPRQLVLMLRRKTRRLQSWKFHSFSLNASFRQLLLFLWSLKQGSEMQDKQLNNISWVHCFIYWNTSAMLLIVYKWNSPTVAGGADRMKAELFNISISKNVLQSNSINTKSVCFKSKAVNNKLLQKYRKSVYLRHLKRKSSPSVVVCSSSSLSHAHLCITPRSPRLYLKFSLLHSSKQAATDVVQIPACGALERRDVCADVESQRKSRREARFPQLPEVGLWTRGSGDEGDVAVESSGRRVGFREAAREQEGVRHGL